MDLLKPSDATTDAPVIFRGKKRKFFRQRPLEDEATGATGPATESIETQDETIASPKTATQVEEALSVAEIIRQRNARKSRTRGVGFGADDAHGSAFHPDVELSLMIREEEQRADDLASGGVNRRFAAQTGLTSELVNKHM